AEGLIWCGSDDGLVHLTRDGGKNWTDVTPKDMPAWGRIDLIDASPFDAGTAYIAVDYHESGDQRPYIYKTDDYGRTWTKITNGIPGGAYVHAVREDPKRKGLLFAGTETGVYVSFDDGSQWQPLQLNLPHAPVYDMVVHNNDLVVATHGRAFWILDDISPLRQISRQIAASNPYLYKPEPAYRVRGGQGHPRGAVAQNAPSGAIIDYYLKQAPPENKTKPAVTLEILDSQGRTVRKFTNLGRKRDEETEGPPEEPSKNTPRNALPAKAGLNRFVWNLRYQGPHEIPHAGAVYSDWGPDAPLAVPGKYEVKLTAEGQILTQPLEVKLDPRVKVSEADLQKQFDLAMKIRDEVSRSSDTVNQILGLETQLNGLENRLAGDSRGEPLLATAKSVGEKANAVAAVLYQPEIKASEDSLNYPIRLRYQLAALGDVVDSADAAPTAQSYALYQTLSRKLDAQLARWGQIQTKDVRALNALALKLRVGVVIVSPPHPAKGDYDQAEKNPSGG
ncbi:MAG: WD40/YVTN/BNR-like repeat-containing protein, partial [Terriglobia bacterium]